MTKGSLVGKLSPGFLKHITEKYGLDAKKPVSFYEEVAKKIADDMDNQVLSGLLGTGTATTTMMSMPHKGSSFLESTYKELKELADKHPVHIVTPKAPKYDLEAPFNPESYKWLGLDPGSDSIDQMSNLIIGIDSGAADQSVMNVKILKSSLVPKDQLYILGDGFKNTAMITGIGKPEKPATMGASPKKGINVKDLPIYRFGPKNEGNASMVYVLGGKGANLAEMAAMGFPVPAGYTIPCDVSVIYLKGHNKDFQAGVMDQMKQRVAEGDQYLFEQFGFHPLVSVRSGAPVSMPGMMDTILNVGITEENLPQWKERIGERAALDSYRRFLQMYGATALDIHKDFFEQALDEIKATAKVKSDCELDAGYLERLIKRYKDIYKADGKIIPQTRQDAIIGAVEAVFRSWDSPRAKAYRADNDIPFDMGTAVNVQAMVFGNMDDLSCSGVAFTRDKANGANTPSGDFLVNAQGEEVVAGTRTPEPLHKMQKWNGKVFNELLDLMGKLEQHYKDMQDVEFTVQHGKLFMLQTRRAKRSALAEFVVAYDMVKEGLIPKDEAMRRVRKDQLLTLMKPSIDPKFTGKPIATGLPVGGGVVSGRAVMSADDAIKCNENGMKTILIRKETTPDDYMGIKAAAGVLTATGGPTAHAAVVCNGLDKPCVVGCTDLLVGMNGFKVKGKTYQAGKTYSIDGTTGNVYEGEVPMIEPQITGEVRAVAEWFFASEKAYRVTAATVAELGFGILAAPEWAKTIYVDTCSLSPAEVDKLSILGNILQHEKADGRQFVIDLSGPESAYEKSDKAINRMFGLGLGTQDHADMKALELLSWDKAHEVLRTVVKVPKSCTVTDQLRAHGFKIVGPVKTVSDLLYSKGAVTIDEETVLKVFGSKEALLFVQEAMGKAGLAPGKPVPEPEYWWDPLMRQGA